MFRTKFFGVAIIVVGVLAARPLFADEDEDMSPADAKQIVKAMDEAKTTLAAGMKTAEESGKCKVVSAGGEIERGKEVIGVYCLAGDKLMDMDVDIKTGKVVQTSEVKPHAEKGAKKDADEDEDEMTVEMAKTLQKGMDEAKMTLATAIKAAEDSCKGKAVKAECEMEKGKLIVGVYCLAGEKLMDIDVDAKTGKVVESKEAGAPEKEKEKKEAPKPKKP